MIRSCHQLLVGGLSLGLLGGFLGISRAGAQLIQPNVVLIMAEGHALEAYGAYGGSQAWTPHLDRLAAEGVRFTRAYCATPTSSPSRLALLTGRSPYSIGVTRDFTSLNHHHVTIADVLKHDRYVTAGFGRLGFPDEIQRQATQPFYGFDLWIAEREYFREIVGSGLPPAIPAAARVQSAWRPLRDPARLWLNAEALPVGQSEGRLPDTLFVGQAVAFIRQNYDRPFFVVVGLTQPEAPFRFPVEHVLGRPGHPPRFDPANFDSPEPGPADEETIPLAYRDLTPEDKAGITTAYFTAVAYLDRSVGALLRVLDELRLNERTIVIYAATSGYLLGQHGWFDRHALWEPAVRAPLVIRWRSGLPEGLICGGLVELTDVFPTLCGLIGRPLPPGLEGINLRPAFNDPEARLRSEVVAGYPENEEAMTRDARYKLIYSTGKRRRQDGLRAPDPPPGPSERLYDLLVDPGETRNLAASPEHAAVLQGLRARLLERFERTHPAGTGLPETATLEEKLDLYLQPREIWALVAEQVRARRDLGAP